MNKGSGPCKIDHKNIDLRHKKLRSTVTEYLAPRQSLAKVDICSQNVNFVHKKKNLSECAIELCAAKSTKLKRQSLYKPELESGSGSGSNPGRCFVRDWVPITQIVYNFLLDMQTLIQTLTILSSDNNNS